MTTEEDHRVKPRLEPKAPGSMDKAARSQEQAAAVTQALLHAFPSDAVGHGDASALARLGVRYRFEPGAHVLRRESLSDALWLVESGQVTVGMADRQGNWRQTRCVGPGQWLDMASGWLGGDYFESAKATTPVVAHEFPLDGVRRLCSLRPNLAHVFVIAMAARIKQITDAAHDLAVRDVPARLANWLLEQLGRQPGSGSTVVMRQHKRSLASELGTSPETFSRALSRLRGLGFLAVRGYTVDVLDREGLERFAGRKLAPPVAARSRD